MTHLECARTGQHYDADALHNLSEVGAPLLARYNLEKAADALSRDQLQDRPANMWRYREVMPISTPTEIVSLGEGKTLDDGNKTTFSVAVGDRVLFTSYAGTDVKYAGVDYIIMREDDILGVLA